MLSNNDTESPQNMGRNSPEEQTRLSSVNQVAITMEIAEDGNKIDIASSHQEAPAAMSLGEAAQLVHPVDFKNHTSPSVTNQMETTTLSPNSTHEEPPTQNGQEKVLRFPSRRVSVVSASSRKFESSKSSHDPHSNGQIKDGTLPASLRILSQLPNTESREVGKSQNPTEGMQKQSSTHSNGVEKILSTAKTKSITPEGTGNSTNRHSVLGSNVDPTGKSTSSTGPQPGQSRRGPTPTAATQPTSPFPMEFDPFLQGGIGGILPQPPDLFLHRTSDGPRFPTGTSPLTFSSLNDPPLSPYPSQPGTSPTHRQGSTPTKQACASQFPRSSSKCKFFKSNP